MKDQKEIQRAHDLLVGCILGEAPLPRPMDEMEKEKIGVMASVLCWVLQHSHNPLFGDYLARFETELKANGIYLFDESN